jgi:hypothetical protein
VGPLHPRKFMKYVGTTPELDTLLLAGW